MLNSLAVLTAASLAGADLALAALALNQLRAPVGRGARMTLKVSGGTALLIDESYNANPASMAAAIALLGQANIGPQGRRIAVLGDMLELGDQGEALHAALAGPIDTAHIDLVYCSGPLMHSLWQALPSGRRGGLCRDGGATRTGRAFRPARRRRGHGQGIVRLENGPHRQGDGTAIFWQAGV